MLDRSTTDIAALQARVVALADGPTASRLDALAALAFELAFTEPRAGLEHAVELTAAARTHGEPGALARGLQACAIARYYLADFDGAERDATQAFDLFDEQGDAAGKADTLSTLSDIRLRLGDPLPALDLATASAALAEEAGDAPTLGWALNSLSNAYGGLGDRRRCVDLSERARAVFEASGHELGRAYLGCNLGWLYASGGRIEDGIALLAESVRAVERLAPTALGRALVMLGEMQLRAGDLEAAEATLEAGLASARTNGVADVEALALAVLGGALRAAGDAEGAVARCREALVIARAAGSVEVELSALAGEAAARVALGEVAAGEALAAEVATSAAARGAWATLEELHATLTAVHESSGDLRRALAHAKRLLATREAALSGARPASEPRDQDGEGRRGVDGVAAILARVRELYEIRPICSYCHAIHDGEAWTSLERYMHRHHRMWLSHGICPACYPEASRALPGAAG